MNNLINVTGRHVEINEPLREYVDGRLAALASDTVIKTSQINVMLSNEKNRYGVSAESFALRLEALELLRPALRQRFVRRIREWKAAHDGAEPNPSARKSLRHSRFSDLRMLVRPSPSEA